MGFCNVESWVWARLSAWDSAEDDTGLGERVRSEEKGDRVAGIPKLATPSFCYIKCEAQPWKMTKIMANLRFFGTRATYALGLSSWEE